ncbi:dipeptide ABC transporter ATP-binding protein [Lysinibacillus mangiferihumi]|uniref:Dipeptide ABC transporter ATP-binding protein n=1 Tax=Lysinibacillus mangiferihumi TaxID=1130819 RepID=A0A4U2YQ97_9BACI|nr:dipeptide ABC transporter ATP-binding protein [Lysinibacillus mangiferihumi]TKI63559.1 dipeptide ABC transporter ATP-binding protein [Lysinibacillus mangiferihumi]
MTNPLLEVKHLKKYFPLKGSRTDYLKAVDDVSFTVNQGEVLGIVGESGCGKSTMGKTLIQLFTPTEGEILLNGENITVLSSKKVRQKRREMQIIFQDPFASLNPRMKVFKIIEEPLVNFRIGTKEERKQRVYDVAKQVGLTHKQLERFPHEFSGGQRQRIGIARALVSNPKLIVADEPVSALDVSIQSQVLNIMKDLKKELNLTYIFISHDLSVVHHFCDRIGVMYLGKIVEIADKHELFNNPKHPYTKALLSALPKSHPLQEKERIVLKGDVPNPANPPSGCTFHTRCPNCMEICKVTTPVLKSISDKHEVSCLLYEELEERVL